MSKSGWSPFNGMKLKGSPVATIINGTIKMIEGKVFENLTEKLLILIKVIFLLFSLNSKLFAQTFEYSENYLEAPLIFLMRQP